MKLTGIAESGSTKADWVFLDENGAEKFRLQTKGCNPLLLSAKEITNELSSEKDLTEIKDEVTALFFYGAGCKTPEAQNQISQVLKEFFRRAQITVKTDLDAACLAVYDNEFCLVGILGTGSNACLFDGKMPKTLIPSLGYVLGDEGSGNHIGRELIRAYFLNQMPENLKTEFQQQFDLNLSFVLENVYRKPKANAYLADFSRFAYDQKENAFIQDLVKKCFREFTELMLKPYHPGQELPVHFVGSVAFYFQDLLREVLQQQGLKAGNFIHKPIDGLVKFHADKLQH